MRATSAWLIGIVALGAILDLYCLGCAPLSQNEAISYAVAMSRGGAFVQLALRDKPETSLYYILLHSWIALGASEFALRMLSAIFAVAAIPVLYALARRLFEVRTALVATTMLAVNASFMMQAQNARCYSMSAFLVLLATFFLVDSNLSPGRTKSILYVVAMAAAIYTHILAILLLPAHAAWIFAADTSRLRAVRFAKQMLALALLLIPLGWLTLRSQLDQFDWIPPLSALSFKDMFSGFLGAPYGPSNFLRRIYLGFYSVALIFGLVGFAQSWTGPREHVAAWILSAAGFLLPAVLLLAISAVHPLYQFRYLVMALPFCTLFAAAGLAATSYRGVSSIILSTIVILSIFTQLSIHRLPNRYPWPLLTRRLIDNSQSGDATIILPGFLRFPIDYYAARFNARDRMPSIAYPDWDSKFRVCGHYVEGIAMRGENPCLRDALERSYPRLWIVLPTLGTPASAHELRALSARYKCRVSETFADLELIRFDNCSDASANQ